MKTIQEMLDLIESSLTLDGLECIGSANNSLIFISDDGENTYQVQIIQKSL